MCIRTIVTCIDCDDSQRYLVQCHDPARVRSMLPTGCPHFQQERETIDHNSCENCEWIAEKNAERAEALKWQAKQEEQQRLKVQAKQEGRPRLQRSDSGFSVASRASTFVENQTSKAVKATKGFFRKRFGKKEQGDPLLTFDQQTR